MSSLATGSHTLRVDKWKGKEFTQDATLMLVEILVLWRDAWSQVPLAWPVELGVCKSRA